MTTSYALPHTPAVDRWLATLSGRPTAAGAAVPDDPAVPTPAEAGERLRLLAVPAADRAAVLTTPPGTADPDRLPRDSTLQRAIRDHLRAGGHWRLAHGWTPLRPAAA